MLKTFMERAFNHMISGCSTSGYNHRSVQFSITHEGVSMEVDLLASPYWTDPKEFYDFLRRWIPRGKRNM